MIVEPRPSKEEYYLGIADAVLKRSTCIRRRYGAVIVRDDEIVSTGYNGSPRGEVNCCDIGKCQREELNVPKGERYELCSAIHAEENALLSAARKDCLGSKMYICGRTTDNALADGKPCLMCAKAIRNMGVTEVIFYDTDGKIQRMSGGTMVKQLT
jgi:dCMP deaminase